MQDGQRNFAHQSGILELSFHALDLSLTTMGYSQKCSDPKTRWDRNRCIRCTLPSPGHETTPNCGFDDHGGRHEPPTKPCKNNTFNTGSSFSCEPCTACPPGQLVVRPCSVTADTVCGPSSNQTTAEVPVTEPTTSEHVSSVFTSSSTTLTSQKSSITPSPTDAPGVAWAVPLTILISIMIAAMAAFVVSKKWKRGRGFNREYVNHGFAPLTASANGTDLEDMLNADILSAPLQTVLDNLDVLEELVILLDPETHGRKNTRHLACHCSFPSTWITYTYSMKDSKSPLKAVLEGVTCRHPDWTVGHLAKMLRLMERNDAIAALAKLRLNKTDV